MRRPLKRLAGDRRAVTIIEFAIVAPVMLLLMMGLGDLLYQIYVQSILQGAVQKAGRDSGVQGGSDNIAVIDGKVITIVGKIVQNLSNDCSTTPAVRTWCSTRKNYDTFTEVAPEPFTDTNHNGVRDPGECFTDENGNGTWDADPGFTGQGGANDVTLYTMTIKYPHIFPVWKILGWTTPMTISASTMLKNQPYASQSITATTTVCT